MKSRTEYHITGTLVFLAVGGFVWWRSLRTEQLPPGFASGNARIKATEVDVATKQAGRVEAVRVKEGDIVGVGQMLAQLDAAVLRAQLHGAEPGKRQAEEERNVTISIAKQRESGYTLAKKPFERTLQIAKEKVIEQKQLDADGTKEQTAKAVWEAAKAQVASAEAEKNLRC